jgi:trehalose/maltose hydrolase-like predicted phosphorylase
LGDAWTLVLEGWDPQDEGRREALCTLGNGRFATRGAAPESVADGVHYPGTYAAGCYNRLRDEIDGQVVENESMVNLPNWLDLRFAVDDGDHEDPAWVDLSQVQVLQHKVELDLRRGLLHRKLRFTDGAGRTTAVRQRRFVHMGQSQLAGLHSVFTAENWSGRLLVASGVDGTVTNAGVPRYAGMGARHLDVVQLREIDPLTLLLVGRTTQSDLCIAEAVRTTVCRGGTVDDVPRRLQREPARIAHRLELALLAGQPVAVEKVASLVTSRDVGISAPAVAAAESLADVPPFERLLQTHELAWHQLWRRFRLQLRSVRGLRWCGSPGAAGGRSLCAVTAWTEPIACPAAAPTGSRSSSLCC